MSHLLFDFLVQYKYWVIFPIAIAEGPILALVCGFLISLGVLSFIPTLIVIFIGDIISDSIYYSLGKHGRRFVEKIKFLKITEYNLQKLESHYEKHPGKTIILSKASYGVGSLFLAAAGASKMSYQKFLEYITPTNLVRSTLLLLAGYSLGKAIRSASMYIEYYTIGVIILLPLAYYIFKKTEQYKEAHDQKNIRRI